jgi:cytochrome P450
MTPFVTTDLAGVAHKRTADETYARLRAKTPVARVQLPIWNESYIVLRYADVSAMLKDNRLAKDPANALTAAQLKRMPSPPKFLQPLTRNMLGVDDPDHARLKKLVQAGFTPRRMEALEVRAETIAHELINRIGTRGRFDLMADFAMPFPVMIISELLGVPLKDQARFARWSHTLLGADPTSWRMLLALPDIFRFLHYLKHLIAVKRASPADDMVSALVQIEGEGDRLSPDELMAMIAILLSAGHETTSNLIGNGTLALLQNQDVFEQLKTQPVKIASAIEELLRFSGPVEMSTPRYAREDVEIAGHLIPRGSPVFGVVHSANRDEAQFAKADHLDLNRSPNRHLTFGEGGHYCVGAALARMEGRIAFTAMMQRWPGLQLSDDTLAPEWKPGAVLRGLRRLELKVAP